LGLALPGGFVDYGEELELALVREMKEETTLDVSISYLQNIYSHPSRDKRMHTASAVYVCTASGTPKGEDDAKEAKVYALDEIPLDRLVFDHALIVNDYLKTKQASKKLCPLCHKENLCQVDVEGDCWCANVEVPLELIQRIPFSQRNQSCICNNCIKEYHDHS
jgi:8-oxo-dGTP diphosphatase